MLKIEEIKMGAKVKVINNPAISENVYEIFDVEVTERGLMLILQWNNGHGGYNKRDEKPKNCELV